MQRRTNASLGGGGGERETILHQPTPTHPVNPRNLHSSPPPGSYSLSSSSNTSAGSSTVAQDYQRFSSPPVNHHHQHQQQQQQQHIHSGIGGHAGFGGGGVNQEYQRFSSPPAGPGGQQGQPSLYAATAAGPHHASSQGGSGSHFMSPQQQGYMGGAGGPNQNAPWGQFGMMNDATAQMGMQFGRSAVAAGQDYVNKNVTRHLPVSHLLHSFNVSNSYVLHKLRLVLFPWRHRPWSRLVKRNETSGQVEGYKPPRDDINSPDMYIPVMALVTYILLAGVVTGTRGDFHPDNLGMTASKSLGIVFIEFCLVKLGAYLLNIGGEGTVVDLFSYSGYKFVGIILTLLVQLVNVRGWLYWTVFTYAFCSNAFFLLRSLRYVVLPDPSLQGTFETSNTPAASSVTHAQRSRRIKFLFFIAASQIVSMWYLIRV